MQTFITSHIHAVTAMSLDMKRLGKQRVEAKQIMLAIENPDYGWQNHPAVNMWRGWHNALAVYGFLICKEWRNRGYKDTLLPFFEDRIRHDGEPYTPGWITAKLIRSHRSNLIRKMPEHYGKLWPDVPNDLPYVWPV